MSWQKLSEEQLQEIEAMAGVLFSEKETALALGLDVAAFAMQMEDEASPEYRAYQKGRLQSLYKVRKNVFDMAANGSGPAQTLVTKLFNDYAWKEKFKEA